MKDQIAHQRTLAQKDGESGEIDMKSLKNELRKINAVDSATGQQFMPSGQFRMSRGNFGGPLGPRGARGGRRGFRGGRGGRGMTRGRGQPFRGGAAPPGVDPGQGGTADNFVRRGGFPG